MSSRFSRFLLGSALPLVLALASASPASAQDQVRVSVKHILNSDGVRSGGIYLFDLAIQETFWEMNKALASMNVRWRFELVDHLDVEGASEFYDFEDSEAMRSEFEGRARDEDPQRFHWRSDAINIFVVNDIVGDAGGFSSFPGSDGSHRDIILIQDKFNGSISSLSGGWLHEIGHYLSLMHTFECFKDSCDQKVCQGEGAAHRNWSMKCPDVCPHDDNLMSYNDTKGQFEITGKFTQCQIDNMDFELYDPRGDRGNVIYPCRDACSQKAATCKSDCEGVRSSCYSACDVSYDICHGGCATAGDICRGTCEATGAVCRTGCDAAIGTCDAGCDVACFFNPGSQDCQDCLNACARLRAGCEAPCDQVEEECKAGCPTPADCDAECASTRSTCRSDCDQVAETCLGPCRQIENDCLSGCQPWPTPAENLARRPGVSAIQTSTYGGEQFPAAFAIDGSLDTFTHTDSADTAPARWILDLGAEFDLETVVLENRHDCCRSRLRDITVTVLDPHGNATFTSSTLNSKNGLVGAGLAGPQRLVLHFPYAAKRLVRGRIIEVKRTADLKLEGSAGQGGDDEARVLALAEVEVYGSPVPPSPEVNLVLSLETGSRMSARQSTTGYGGDAGRAVDGVRNGDYNALSVSHTADGDPAPWWEVDLGYAFPIGRVVLWNRTDCCSARLSNFKVSVLGSTRELLHSSLHFSDGGYPDTSASGYEIAVPGVTGRFVRIELLGDLNGAGLALALAEVEVYAGSPPAAGPRFVRGDADSSGSIDISDPLVVLTYLFIGGAEIPCLDAADADDEGPNQPTITDAILVLSWLFSGGSAPMPPGPSGPRYQAGECGVDPTPEDGMGCAQGSSTCQ